MIHPWRRLCGLEKDKDPYEEMLGSIDTRQLAHIKQLWNRYLPRIAVYLFGMGFMVLFAFQLAIAHIEGSGMENMEKLVGVLDEGSTVILAFLLGAFITLWAMYMVLDDHLQKRLDEAEKVFFLKDKP